MGRKDAQDRRVAEPDKRENREERWVEEGGSVLPAWLPTPPPVVFAITLRVPSEERGHSSGWQGRQGAGEGWMRQAGREH